MFSKKIIAGMMAASFLSYSAVASAANPESVSIGRCSIPASTSLFSRTPGGLPSDWVTKTVAVSNGIALPDVMVDGWPARTAPADILLQELMAETGLIYSGPGALPSASWNGGVMTLDSVVSSIVSQFGGHWTFDGTTLSVSKNTPVTSSTASVDLPIERDLRLATIDILRAYDLDVRVVGSTVMLEGSSEEMRKARKALADAKSVTVMDVFFLRGRPEQGRYDWSGLGAIRAKPAGAGGSFVFTDAEPELLIQRLVARGDLVEDSAQSVAAPAGWGLAVPPSQCGAGSGEVVVTSKTVGDKVDLTLAGSMFDAQFPDFVMGSTAASVIKDPQDGWIKMVLVRPRVVSFSSR